MGLASACRRGDRAAVQRCLYEGADPNATDKNGSTPLMHSAWQGDMHIVQTLLEAGADPNLRNIRLNTALHFALERGHSDIAQFLLQRGASVDKNALGLTPFDVARKTRGFSTFLEDELEAFYATPRQYFTTLRVGRELDTALTSLGLSPPTAVAAEDLSTSALRDILRQCMNGFPDTESAVADSDALQPAGAALSFPEFSSLAKSLRNGQRGASTANSRESSEERDRDSDRDSNSGEQKAHEGGATSPTVSPLPPRHHTPSRSPVLPTRRLTMGGSTPAPPSYQAGTALIGVPAASAEAPSDAHLARSASFMLRRGKSWQGFAASRAGIARFKSPSPIFLNQPQAAWGHSSSFHVSRTAAATSRSPQQYPQSSDMAQAMLHSRHDSVSIDSEELNVSVESQRENASVESANDTPRFSDEESEQKAGPSTEYSKPPVPEVFLGGACNPTTWRLTTAIPALERAGVSYFNPQVDTWSPDLVAVEAAAKEGAKILFFVIDNQTRGIASMVEASELIASGRSIVLVVQNIPKGKTIDYHVIDENEAKDLNRGRDYLRDVARRHGLEPYDTIEDGLDALLRKCKDTKG